MTPVREALRILERERYVAPIPNRGFYVSEITLKEAEALFEPREAFEVLAVEKAIKHREDLRGS